MTGAKLRVYTLTITACGLTCLAIVLDVDYRWLFPALLCAAATAAVDAALYIRDMARQHTEHLATLEADHEREMSARVLEESTLLLDLENRDTAIRNLDAGLEYERAAICRAYMFSRELRLEDALRLLDAIDGIDRNPRGDFLSPAQLETRTARRAMAHLVTHTRKWASRAKTAEAQVAEMEKQQAIDVQIMEKADSDLDGIVSAGRWFRQQAERTQKWGEQEKERANRYRTRLTTARAAIQRVRDLAADVDDPTWRAPGTEVAARIRLALTEEPNPPKEPTP